MPRPLTCAQAIENQAFLAALARSGNIRLAARETGLKYGTVQHRRRHHPGFAQQFDVALVMANARFHENGGRRAPEAPRGRDPQAAHRTRGGEPVVVRCRDGRLQVRAAQPGKLTLACEKAFLSALGATANVRLSAAAAGASVAAFYRRRRKNPAFAREMQLALERGYEQIKLALIAGLDAESHDHGWQHGEPPPMPQMSVSQAIQLLYIHQKEARLWTLAHDAGRSGSASGDVAEPLAEWEVEAWRREGLAVPRAARVEGWTYPSRDPGNPVLPALDRVTGWSSADPQKVPHHPERALFGGWRREDLDRQRVGERAGAAPIRLR